MPSNTKQWVYFVFMIMGICSTWYFNIQFMSANGTDIRDFIKAVTLNDAAMSIACDISIIAIAFLFWSYQEAKKLGMKNWWVYPVISMSIAIAFGGPLFLFLREKRLEKLKQESA